MAKTEGYIVTGKWGTKCLDNRYKPKGAYKGVLKNGGPATLFETKARAKGAMKRTKKYAEEKGYDNPAWDVSNIVRVVSE